MPFVYTHREYADMLYIYGFCDGDSNNAVTEYRRRFPTRRTPSSRVFVRAFRSVRSNGTVPSAGINYERVVIDNDEVRDNILRAVQRSPRTSTRRIARQHRVSQSRVWRLLHDERLYSYHLQRVQDLQPDDYNRVQFCRWLNSNRELHNFILFCDEAKFTRNGVFNSRNSHVWASDNLMKL